LIVSYLGEVAELARACEVSETTVVRFIGQLEYASYADFQLTLRDIVDSDLTLLDRAELTDRLQPGADRFRRVVSMEAIGQQSTG
jgi:DNA-binding MurR/RpiR family transcriptional regulator